MTAHASHLIETLSSPVSKLVGILLTAASVTSAQVNTKIDVMQYVWLSLPSNQGVVEFTVQGGVTISGAIVAVIIGAATLIKMFSKKSK